MTRSFDDGQTWVPNIRASAQTWDWSLNLPLDGSGYGFIGDYQGIASNNDFDFPFWNATANLGENAENYQEIFIALVPTDLLQVDLSPSLKTVSPAQVAPGEALTFSVVLANTGPDEAPAARLTDTLPVSTTYVAGSLSFPPGVGTGGYDPATRAITWTGPVSAGVPVTVTFQATVGLAVADHQVIENVAHIADGAGGLYERTAAAEVLVAPFVVSTSPGDGESGVPVGAPLVVTFSAPVVAATLHYTTTPDPGGWSATWSPDYTVVTLVHSPLAYLEVYTARVTVEDAEGQALVPGPAPNPWTFSTQGPPTRRLYLPLVRKGGG